jgi:DNA-binding transcriptional ArsR family regulator
MAARQDSTTSGRNAHRRRDATDTPGAVAAEDSASDAVFRALAHPVRRRLLDLVRAAPGCNVNDVCQPFALSRIAVMKHLRVLEDAGLLLSRKSGRNRELFFNVVPIQQVYDRWTTEYGALWARRLLDLKRRVETAPTAADRGDAAPLEPSG